ncbi:MAG TPA: two-component regulator propeller domain-containing protein [Balneolaceae bacterium]|nr:two-component regulator propeller domain-containing protein [Balneolaceae bacterium]
MKRALIVLIFIIGMSRLGFGQKLPFRTYSIEKGLSEAVVNDLMQDSQGYLWIATSYGLNRFDGVKFQNYYSEDGLLANKIYSLYEDGKGDIWIGTGGGVNVMRADSIYTLPYLKPLESSTIVDIYQDHQGDFWFATDGEGVWHMDQNEDLTQYRQIHGMGDDRVRAITEDNSGVLWFATRDGLTKLDNGNFRTFTTKDGLADNRLRDLVVGNDGSLWIASRGGLCNYKDEKFHCYTEKDGLIDNGIQSISKDDNGNLWLGTEQGASYFDHGTFTNYTADEGLANNIIYATEYDREGNIWFGTFGGGVSILLGQDFENYTVEQGLPNEMITTVTEDQSGRHWIGTFGGIAKMQNDKFTTYSAKNGLVDDKVYTIKAGNGDSLLIGTRSGFSIFNQKKFHNFGDKELPYRKIRAVLNPKHSAGIWLGTYGEGLLHYQNGKFTHLTEEDGLANNTILALAETADGSIWIANYGGVSQLKNGKFTNYSIKDGLPNNGVLDILKSNSGDLWFATFGGIARFDNGNFETITADDGLPDEVCYFINQDNRGIFWIGTNKGVIRFDYDAYQSDDETIRSRAFKLVTQNQGLVANEMNAGASFKDREGNLWFGSVEGVTKFDPSKERINTVAPTVHIENMQMSGENIPIDSHIKIGSDSHNITFDFIGISFSAPEQVLYKYRLKNSGEDWQQTSQRSVRYSTLVPGDYTFEVKARNNDGRWSKEAATVSFTVLAPFWMRWWFIGLMLLVLIGIVLFAYNYYRVRKLVEIERMRVRIASDLHDDVGSALTEIALQSDFLQTMNVTDELQESLQQIGTQSRKIVTSLDDIVWSIDARNDTVGDLTDRMQDYVNSVLPQKQIKYHFEGDMQEKLKVSLKENLYLIFKESINNIAKHSNADRVDVTLSTNGAGFEMRVKDNGESSTNVRKSGQGLRNMKMRAKRVDADVSFNNNDGFEVVVKSIN